MHFLPFIRVKFMKVKIAQGSGECSGSIENI